MADPALPARQGTELECGYGPGLEQDFPRSEIPMDQSFNPFNGWPVFEALSDEEKLRFGWHNLAWMLAQFMHGEQGLASPRSWQAAHPPMMPSSMLPARPLMRHGMWRPLRVTFRKRSASSTR